MCGIFGFAELDDEARRMAPLLAIQMESRGADSWGASDGEHFVKFSGAISKTWELPGDWTKGIFHTRQATSGSRTSAENAHPHQVGNIIGIHNGIISNDTEMNAKHGRDYEVDSIHIWAHMDAGLSMEELNGYAACAWYDLRKPGVLYLWRSNHDAMHVAALASGNIVFASTDTAIVRAAQLTGVAIEHFYEINEHTRYFIKKKDDKFVLYYDESKIRLGARYKYNPATEGRTGIAGRRGGYAGVWDNWYGDGDSCFSGSTRSYTPHRSSAPDYFTGPNASGGSPDESTTCAAHHKQFCRGKVAIGEGLCDKCLEVLALKAAEDKALPDGLAQMAETAALEIASGATKQNSRTAKQNSATSC